MRHLSAMILSSAIAISSATGGAHAADVTAPQSDAARMNAQEMNPGTALMTTERVGDGAFKVLIYGNSIALHGPKPSIGWTNSWGMAASAREKDFAHLVVAALEERRGERADFRIRNLATLERNYTASLDSFPELAADVAWAPDYVVVAIGENAPTIDEAAEPVYTDFLASLARPLVESAKHPPVVLRSPFWRNVAKARCTERAAARVGARYADASALADAAENKAIGLFSHSGVANHPGDLGMRRLADLILAALAQ